MEGESIRSSESVSHADLYQIIYGCSIACLARQCRRKELHPNHPTLLRYRLDPFIADIPLDVIRSSDTAMGIYDGA
jgi:hypothetical protein